MVVSILLSYPKIMQGASNISKKNGISINSKTFRGLRMKSLAYCSFAIEDNGLRVGIILFKSTKHGVLEKSKLKDFSYKSHSYFIEVLRKAKTVSSLIENQAEDKHHV